MQAEMAVDAELRASYAARERVLSVREKNCAGAHEVYKAAQEMAHAVAKRERKVELMESRLRDYESSLLKLQKDALKTWGEVDSNEKVLVEVDKKLVKLKQVEDDCRSKCAWVGKRHKELIQRQVDLDLGERFLEERIGRVSKKEEEVEERIRVVTERELVLEERLSRAEVLELECGARERAVQERLGEVEKRELEVEAALAAVAVEREDLQLRTAGIVSRELQVSRTLELIRDDIRLIEEQRRFMEEGVL
uniref:Uncharacterized protein n=1 Tax=Mucochytrium quahogii TaxID=96639 RepID=A0A7S2RQS8_9STRA|mmetsp:Transcript_17436/g.28146  ORF Transcript_17436/g.28146 Transcript_17436/m.28146 type:complete len:251 (+) Transcript_17436:61-813(+)